MLELSVNTAGAFGPHLFPMSHLLVFFRRLIAQDRWFVFALTTAPITWLISVAVTVPLLLSAQPEQLPERFGWMRLFSGLIFAPVIENLVMVVLIALARNVCSTQASIAIMVVIAALAHVPISPWVAIPAIVGFTLLGVTYMAWRPSGATRAYWITVLQHAILNMPATVIGAFFS